MTDRELEAYRQAMSQSDRMYRDEHWLEDAGNLAATHPSPDPAPDEHLEAAYEGYFDIDDGRWDDDPNPYAGTYSED